MNILNGHTTKVLIGLLTALTLFIWNDLRGDVRMVQETYAEHATKPHDGALLYSDLMMVRELIADNKTMIAAAGSERSAIISRLDRIESKVDRLLEAK